MSELYRSGVREYAVLNEYEKSEVVAPVAMEKYGRYANEMEYFIYDDSGDEFADGLHREFGDAVATATIWGASAEDKWIRSHLVVVLNRGMSVEEFISKWRLPWSAIWPNEGIKIAKKMIVNGEKIITHDGPVVNRRVKFETLKSWERLPLDVGLYAKMEDFERKKAEFLAAFGAIKRHDIEDYEARDVEFGTNDKFYTNLALNLKYPKDSAGFAYDLDAAWRLSHTVGDGFRRNLGLVRMAILNEYEMDDATHFAISRLDEHAKSAAWAVIGGPKGAIKRAIKNAGWAVGTAAIDSADGKRAWLIYAIDFRINLDEFVAGIWGAEVLAKGRGGELMEALGLISGWQPDSTQRAEFLAVFERASGFKGTAAIYNTAKKVMDKVDKNYRLHGSITCYTARSYFSLGRAWRISEILNPA